MSYNKSRVRSCKPLTPLIFLIRLLFVVEFSLKAIGMSEMVKFSRRTATQLGEWAARRGYQAQPANILDDAKKKRYERYTCVNIAPSNTVEIRWDTTLKKTIPFL